MTLLRCKAGQIIDRRMDEVKAQLFTLSSKENDDASLFSDERTINSVKVDPCVKLKQLLLFLFFSVQVFTEP